MWGGADLLPKLEWFDIAIAVAFLAFMTWIGNRGHRTRTTEDFFIGGRNVSAGKIGGTVAAGVIGGGVILVFAEYTFRYGLSALSIIAGLFLGILLIVRVALPFKKIADNQRFYTLSDLYYYEWGRKSGFISTIIIGLWTLGFIVMQLISAGEVLHSMTGWRYEWGVIIAAITVSSYLIVSGFKAVVITDVLQYIVLVVLLIFILPLASSRITFGHDLSRVMLLHMNWWEAIGFFLLGSLNIIVSADLWLRIYAARDTATARRGFRIAALLVLLAGILLVVPSVYVRITSPQIPANQALIASLGLLLPRWLLSFGLVGILSTVIATLDTMVFIFGMSVANDLQIRFFNKPIDDRLRSTQITMIIILIFGCILSIAYQKLLSVGLILSMLGLALVPSILLHRINWKPKPLAVEWSMILGLIATFSLIFGGLVNPQYSPVVLFASIFGTVTGSIYSWIRKV